MGVGARVFKGRNPPAEKRKETKVNPPPPPPERSWREWRSPMGFTIRHRTGW